MQKFLKDPWNQLALIVFAMSLSFILIKFDYYRSLVQINSGESRVQTQVVASAPDVITAPSVPQAAVAQLASVPPSNANADADRQPNSIEDDSADAVGSNQPQQTDPDVANQVGSLPPPTKTFAMSDVKITGKGYKWAPSRNSAAGKKIDMRNGNNEWIVDINKGQGSDTDSIQHALMMAKKGDTIKIRNGEYSEEFNMRYDVTIIGENQEKVIVRYKKENLFSENSTVNWQGFTLVYANLNGFNTIHFKDSTVNFKAMNFENVFLNFSKSQVVAEEIKVTNVRSYGGAFNFYENSTAVFSKIKAKNIEGDVFAVREKSELTISEVEAIGIKYAVASSIESILKMSDINATDVESFAFHFSSSKPSTAKKIICTRCKYGFYSKESKLDLQDIEIYKSPHQAFLIDRSELKIIKVKIQDCESGISISNSKMNISEAVITSATRGISIYDSSVYNTSDVSANYVTITSTQTPWDLSPRVVGARIQGSNNNPEIKNRQGNKYVGY